MPEQFYLDTVRSLLVDGWLRPDDDVLVTAGGENDRDVLAAAGMRSVTITNLDERMRADAFAPFAWCRQDAERLTYEDCSFDIGIVHQGLHHCRSPHRGLLELYRVARRGVVLFEPQETLLTRLGVRVGIGQEYEVAAVAGNDLHWGGVQNTDVPNFVYRWTRREVRKTLASFDATGRPRLRCFYDFRVPGDAAAAVRSPVASTLARAAVPLARLILRVAPSQANALAVAADKRGGTTGLHPWLAAGGTSGVRPDGEWFRRHATSSAHASDDEVR